MEGYPSSGRNAERQQKAAGHLELHAIYNSHATAEDALKTVSFIEDDSIVYLEGIELEPIPDDIFYRIVERLGEYKRKHGKNEKYYHWKESLIDEFINSRSTGNVQYEIDEYEDTLYFELLRKDCEVITADYKYSSQPHLKDIVEKSNRTEFVLFDEFHQYSAVKDSLVELEQIIANKYASHAVREESTVDIILKDTQKRLKKPDQTSKGRLADGEKIRAYMVYGAAHSRSLTKKLENTGVAVSVNNILHLGEGAYLEASIDGLKENYLRRLSFAALAALTLKVSDFYDIYTNDEVMAYMYESLEVMNANREMAIAFCVQCLKIRQKHAVNPDSVTGYYIDLISTYSNDVALVN